jgi:hypothetical protein
VHLRVRLVIFRRENLLTRSSNPGF